MNNEDKYRCLICGTPYDTAREMAECIVKCDERRKTEEVGNERKKLEQERRNELAEIMTTKQLLFKQIEDYQRKYPNSGFVSSFLVRDFGEGTKSIERPFRLSW